MSTDVEAIIARKLASLFPDPEMRAEAERLLASYGAGSHEKEVPRVRLAILKNTGAGGDLEALRAQVQLAKTDYRDALVGAEYGRQAHELFTMEPKKRKRLSKQDQDEYIAWLES
jgi:hypothetical protein